MQYDVTYVQGPAHHLVHGLRVHIIYSCHSLDAPHVLLVLIVQRDQAFLRVVLADRHLIIEFDLLGTLVVLAVPHEHGTGMPRRIQRLPVLVLRLSHNKRWQHTHRLRIVVDALLLLVSFL